LIDARPRRAQMFILNERRLLPTIEEQHRKSPINARGASQGDIPSSALKTEGTTHSAAPKMTPPPTRRATAGVSTTQPSPFPNIYKSAYVNALSALRSASEDTSRFSSCNLFHEEDHDLCSLYHAIECMAKRRSMVMFTASAKGSSEEEK
jgi:hypothetical protein